MLAVTGAHAACTCAEGAGLLTEVRWAVNTAAPLEFSGPFQPDRMAIVNDATNAQQMSAEAYLGRLAARGIEYVFANAGTDFAPIIEALSRKSRPFPKVVTVPHENVAMAMAHGYYRIAGKPAAVMVHVTVGTANSINGLMNATRDNVPILLAAGRTPLTLSLIHI